MNSTQRQKQKFESPLPPSLASFPATPLLSCIYTSAVGARNFFYDRLPALPRNLCRPTISIGGIRAGGVGKTPVAQLIGQHVIDSCGYTPVFLSRGYGRVAKQTVIVKPREDASWRDTGDEPCMIHNNLPTSWLGIGADRNAVAAAMLPSLPDKTVFILDDGFQRRQTSRDLDIVCLSESVFNDRMIPRGYLREPLSSLSRAHIILIIGAEERAHKLRDVEGRVIKRFGGGTHRDAVSDTRVAAKPVYAARVDATPITAVLHQYPQSWVNAATGEVVPVGAEPPFTRPVAVSGIARPERFIDMLRSLSVEPSAVRIFADHHKYKKNDFFLDTNIYCNSEVTSVVTTEKDFVRLRFAGLTDARSLWYLKIGLRFADSDSGTRVFSKINDLLT